MSVKLENKVTSIVFGNSENTTPITYANLLNGVIGRQAVDGAWTLEELKARLGVIEILEKNEELEFTEKQFEIIKDEISKAKWTIAHKDILEFAEYILAAN